MDKINRTPDLNGRVCGGQLVPTTEWGCGCIRVGDGFSGFEGIVERFLW